MLTALPGRRRRGGPPPAGGSAPGTTDEPAELVTLPAEGPGPDPAVRARARQIATRLSVPRPRHDTLSRRGAGDLASVPYRGGGDDIDLDRGVLRVRQTLGTPARRYSCRRASTLRSSRMS